MVLCLGACKEKVLDQIDKTGKVIYDPSIEQDCQKYLNLTDCYESGFNSFQKKGEGNLKYKANGFCRSYIDTTNMLWNIEYNEFAYAFYLDNSLHIRMYGVYFGMPASYIEFVQFGNNADCSAEYYKKENITDNFKTLKVELKLNKQSYKVGDVMQGYAFYQAVDNEPKKVLGLIDTYSFSQREFYFQCKVGNSSDPYDNLSSLLKCNELSKELPFLNINN